MVFPTKFPEQGDVTESVELSDSNLHAPRPVAATDFPPDAKASATQEVVALEEQNDICERTETTPADAANMLRMGKDQQFVRKFRLLSITAFTSIATAS